MNLPNKITLSRFVVALMLFAYLVFTDTCSGDDWLAPTLAGGVFVLAVATDALDGHLARKLGLQSDFGRVADPVVDKIIVCGVFIFLVTTKWAQVFVPVWMAVLLVSREFLVTTLRGYIETRGVAFPARWDGKLKMVLQCAAIPAVFMVRAFDLGFGYEYPWAMDFAVWAAHILVWATFLMTVTSGARYVSAAAHVLRAEEGPRAAAASEARSPETAG